MSVLKTSCSHVRAVYWPCFSNSKQGQWSKSNWRDYKLYPSRALCSQYPSPAVLLLRNMSPWGGFSCLWLSHNIAKDVHEILLAHRMLARSELAHMNHSWSTVAVAFSWQEEQWRNHKRRSWKRVIRRKSLIFLASNGRRNR